MLESVIELCQQAGDAVMDIYSEDIKVEIKNDLSPLTLADLKSNEILVAGLKKLTPNIPIISEEISQQEKIKLGAKFWMIDPLDGTKEFIKRNGEFTINVALIENRQPILGVVYAPALGKLYAGIPEKNAFVLQNGGRKLLNCRTPPEQGLTVLGSRSHANEQLLTDFLADKKIAEIIPAGSSLKFCLIAEGQADLYPRLGPTMEWDTAAGHAVLLAAGGEVNNLDGEVFELPKTEL
ncbi:3'(2'),5'-bisphosphate nucleotidase CysQ [Deefgea sp. CFH1-16]|uniref:3'(2'),5'-bisphosphate nucleotidase CysQ n=1 Tax=Deefgea sp. CFH1-16 TaxID=2675457 RepID=UPI00194021C5|nr:3'(2'),5'-bisphosphate nucleotidase CysQ [Deefgea sp. CFH1-16]